MKSAPIVSAWLCAGLAVAAFFLPWLRLRAAETPVAALQKLGRVTLEIRQGGKTLTADSAALSRVPPMVSGAQIPALVRDPNAQTAILVAELVTGEPQHAGAKSLAVYLVPGLALVAAAALTAAGPGPVAWGIAAASAGMAAAGAWKMVTLSPSAATTVAIGIGLWLSVAAYVGLAASAAVHGLTTRGAE